VSGLDQEGRSLCSGRNIGAGSGGDAVLDVGAGEGIGVERLDVEDDRNYVQVKPEAGAEIGSL